LKCPGYAAYRERVNANEREEITASVAAHAELGPRYDAAVAEGLVERIGEEIDRRIDAARGAAPRRAVPSPEPSPPAPHRQSVSASITGMILGLGSIGLGVGATGAVVSHHVTPAAGVFMILLIWLAIAVVNVAHARRR
jgi:hypothetical protein